MSACWVCGAELVSFLDQLESGVGEVRNMVGDVASGNVVFGSCK